MCLAYRRDQCEELYFEHVKGIIDCMENLTVFKSLVRKLSLMFGDREEVIASLMRLLAVVHDIGKLSEDRQKECLYGDCIEFRYHYVVSARVASCLVTGSYEDVEAVLYEKGTGKKSTILYYVVVLFPTLLHHYAQVTEESLEDAIRETSKLQKLQIHEGCKSVLLKLIEKYLYQLLDNEQISYVELKKLTKQVESGALDLCSLPLREPRELFSYSRSKWKYTIEAIVGVLNICDGTVAYLNREERCRKHS